MAQVAGKPKQLETSNPRGAVTTMGRTPFVHPNTYIPGFEARRWRTVAAEPVNRMARRMIQREISSLNWRIRPLDRDDMTQRNAAIYYSQLFKDYRSLTSRALKGICELPQGGAWEVGWIKPALFNEGDRGTLAFVDFLDAGTLHPTTSRKFPVVQIDPYYQLRKVYFQDEQLVRILAHPRDEFDREWWQESPTEASYLAIEAMSRIYVYSLKQLMDTPPLGILDLADFSEDAATNWASSFREMVEGIDHIKIPVLYEHEKPASYIRLSSDFDTLKIPQQFEQYAELILGNYGLSTDDLRILGRAYSKAGAAVSQKVTLRTGIGFFAELIKDSVQSVLPDYLVFEYSEPDMEEERSKAQIEAARARTIQTFPWLSVADRVRIANAWNMLPIELDPETVEADAKKMAEEAMAMAAPQSPPGAGGTAMPKLKPGQLERGEGRNPDVLEDEAKKTSSTGTRTFAKGMTEKIDGVASSIREFLAPPTTGRYGRKKSIAAARMERLLTDRFHEAGTRITVPIMEKFLDIVYTQFPEMLTTVDVTPPEAKSWSALVDTLRMGDYVEKQDDRAARINQILDILLEETGDIYALDDEAFLELITELLTLGYEDGMLGMAELVQSDLHAQGKVRSPAVLGSYRVTDPRVIEILETSAAELVTNIDSGTKYFLRRLIAQGAMQGMGADQLTEHIQSELFGLPTTEAGALSQRRIRSIVNTELNRADSMGRLEQMKAIGLVLKRWITRGVGVCPLCLRNEGKGSVPLDYEFESVFGSTLTPPGHPDTCHCTIGADAEELNRLGMEPVYATGAGAEQKAVFVEKASSNGASVNPDNLYYLLKFIDTTAIEQVQAYLKEQVQGSDIKWERPGDFHVTLVFLPDVEQSMIGHLTAFLVNVPGTLLETDGTGTFSTVRGDKSNVLYLKVRKTPELADLQRRIFNRVNDLGMDTSAYSQPDDWIPHITLAYKDTPFDEEDIPDLGGVGLGMYRVDAAMNKQIISSSDGHMHAPVKVFAE